MTEQIQDTNSQPITTTEAVGMLVSGQTPEDVNARHAVMRSAGGAGYVMAGGMMMEGAGVASKVAGAAMIAKGFHETVVANRALSGESGQSNLFMKAKDRISQLGQSLLDKSSNKMNLVARLRRGVGQELTSVEDAEYRNRFSRLTGGVALTAAGVEFMNQPGLVPQLAGAVLASAGVAESFRNGIKMNERVTELNS